MQKLVKADDFRSHIQRIIDCFCDLLKQVDVSLFANQQQTLTNAAATDGQDKIRPNQLKATIVAVKK